MKQRIGGNKKAVVPNEIETTAFYSKTPFD